MEPPPTFRTDPFTCSAIPFIHCPPRKSNQRLTVPFTKGAGFVHKGRTLATDESFCFTPFCLLTLVFCTLVPCLVRPRSLAVCLAISFCFEKKKKKKKRKEDMGAIGNIHCHDDYSSGSGIDLKSTRKVRRVSLVTRGNTMAYEARPNKRFLSPFLLFSVAKR